VARNTQPIERLAGDVAGSGIDIAAFLTNRYQ